MQEVNFKNFIIFNLFYLRFCFGPQVCIGNSSFSICEFVPCRGSVRNIILLRARVRALTHTRAHTRTHARTHAHTHTHTHTHSILPQHFTDNFSLHNTRYSHATPSQTKKDHHMLSAVPVYWLALSFPVYFSQWGFKNLYMIFPYSVKERVTKTEIFQQLSKNA